MKPQIVFRTGNSPVVVISAETGFRVGDLVLVETPAPGEVLIHRVAVYPAPAQPSEEA